MKVKNIIHKSLLILLLIVVGTTTVKAEDVYYYTNMNGVKLTKEQYNNLAKYFDEDTIATMTAEVAKTFKDEKNITSTEETKYIKTESFFGRNGELIDSIETEVSAEDAFNYKESDISPYSWTGTHQTAMKKLTMKVVSSSASAISVTLTNTWLSLPKVRSYDVIAIRPDSNSAVITVNNASVSAYQKWDGNFIRYNSGDSNTKIVGSLSKGKGGVAVSMNFVDATQTSMENSLTVLFLSNASIFKVSGTYQHCQYDISLSDSQNFSFDETGLGKVLKYSNSLKDKFDNMQGITLDYHRYEELY